MTKVHKKTAGAQAQGAFADLAFHTIGWKAFQNMCAQICGEKLGVPVSIFREAQDGGQDAVFLIPPPEGETSPTGTVQVKHSSDAKKKLAVSDLTQELDHLKQLIIDGQADTYIFITNMTVDAPIAKSIRKKLQNLGVKTPLVWGKDEITLTIKSSPKLRALVPQVYGLGDLSAILDQRAIAQTKAILEDWLVKLKAYVSTNAHDKAVRALVEHGAVLLLGNPSSGKSTIGAILSAMAAENENHSVIQISNPQEFIQHWNPDDKGRFFWIDDAFGSNIVSNDFVQDWASHFNKIPAAIKRGNRFLFTSRRHIYSAAYLRLGNRNLQIFSTGAATVDVGELSESERAQILYNHINFGNQGASWKARVKPHLEAVMTVPGFLPGIAERLGNSTFTKTLDLNKASLSKFMAEPREHLIATIQELETVQQAALVMIYVHRGKFNPSIPNEEAKKAVVDGMGVQYHDLTSRLPELVGSFIKSVPTENGDACGFEHPTISDAMTEILSNQPNMVEVLMRGAPVKTIMSNFVCKDVAEVPNAAIIPVHLAPVMTDRLKTVPNEREANRILFDFLLTRASGDMIKSVFEAEPSILDRENWYFGDADYDPKNRLAVRAHELGVLSEDARYFISDDLKRAAMEKFDLSFLTSESLLALIQPADVLALGMKLKDKISNSMESILDKIQEDADMDDDPETQFERITTSLSIMEEVCGLGRDEDEALAEAYEAIDREIEILTEKQVEHHRESDDEEQWDFHSASKVEEPSADQKPSSESDRSIFHDLDK